MRDTCAQLALGWSGSGVGQRAAENLRESVTSDVMRIALAASDDNDVTGLLGKLVTPTLVLHRPGISWLPVRIARAIASRISGARLVLMEGESTAPYLGDSEAIAGQIEEFLNVETGKVDSQGRW